MKDIKKRFFQGPNQKPISSSASPYFSTSAMVWCERSAIKASLHPFEGKKPKD